MSHTQNMFYSQIRDGATYSHTLRSVTGSVRKTQSSGSIVHMMGKVPLLHVRKPVWGKQYPPLGSRCWVSLMTLLDHTAFAKRIRLMTVHIMIMTHMIATTLFHTKKLTMESVS